MVVSVLGAQVDSGFERREQSQLLRRPRALERMPAPTFGDQPRVSPRPSRASMARSTRHARLAGWPQCVEQMFLVASVLRGL